MKKLVYVGLALGLVAAVASTSSAAQKNFGGKGIVGSSHDLSGTTGISGDGGDPQKRICVFCHHPHNTVSSKQIGYSPLWNRGIGQGTGNAKGQFVAYDNSLSDSSSMMGGKSSIQHMMNGTPAFGGVSLLCMSCHDGVTAMNAYSSNNDLVSTGIGDSTVGAPGTGLGALTSSAGLANFKRNNANNGNLAQGDMSNHHPVGMNWDTYDKGTVTENEIATRDMKFITNADASTPAALTALAQAEAGGKVRTGAGRTGKAIKEVLSGGRMECVTCHDVHNTGNEANAERFLWVSDNNSKFCLSCHLK